MYAMLIAINNKTPKQFVSSPSSSQIGSCSGCRPMISEGVDIVMSSGQGGIGSPSDPFVAKKINIESHLSCLPVNVSNNLGAVFPKTRAIS